MLLRNSIVNGCSSKSDITPNCVPSLRLCKTMPLRLILAANCPKIAAGKEVDACGVYYFDRIG